MWSNHSTFKESSMNLARQKKQNLFKGFVNKRFLTLNDFGHFKDRHYMQSKRKVLDRFYYDPFIKNVSFFVGDENAVAYTLRAALIRCQEEILDWLLDEDDQERWVVYTPFVRKNGGPPVKGRVYRYKDGTKWRERFEKPTEIVLVLEKDGEGWFRVVTAFCN